MLKALMIKRLKLDHLPRQMGEMASWYSKNRVVCNIKNEKRKVITSLAREGPFFVALNKGGTRRGLGGKQGNRTHLVASQSEMRGWRQPLTSLE